MREKDFSTKLTYGFLATGLLLTLSACGNGNNEDNGNGEDVNFEGTEGGENEPQDSEEFIEEKAQAFYDDIAEIESIQEEDVEDIDLEDEEAILEILEDNFGEIVEEYVDTSEIENDEDLLGVYFSIDAMNQYLYPLPDNWVYVARGHTEIEDDIATLILTDGEAQVDEEYLDNNFASFEDYVESTLIENGQYDLGEMAYVDGEWKVILHSPQAPAEPLPEDMDVEDIEIDPEDLEGLDPEDDQGSEEE